MAKTLRLILGDQLNINHSWFEEPNPEITYLLCEARSETDYVRHHIQKVTAFFSAMRAFAEQLQRAGHQVFYIDLNAPYNQGSIVANVKHLLAIQDFKAFSYQLPDEYRLDRKLEALTKEITIPTEVVDSEHFLVQRGFLADLFRGKKTYLMESFYRRVRKQYNLLMEPNGETPLSSRWNYDAENRKKLPAGVVIPPVPTFPRDVTHIVDLLQSQGVETIGNINPTHFDWPLTRDEALIVLESFNRERLSKFGTYQDAMTDRHYLLFHSKLSFCLNVKLISPLEVCQSAIAYWEAHQEDISLSQIEGFVRQIIGWREYMRGVYWAQMPSYAGRNFFGHQRKLPSWYWTGQTKMKCLQHAIGQSLDHAYAHHIQRLMVTGNFALLLGVDPDEVDEWYLGIYIDALQWVEITNTRGMSQFADGGLLATKPYVASANYMHKMGDYCKNCQYQQKGKTEENACPFNSLYWDFMDRHRDRLEKNPRIGMAYRTWDRYAGEQKAAILQKAQWVKDHIEEL